MISYQKVYKLRSWSANFAIDLASWRIGIYYERMAWSLTFYVGPLSLSLERPDWESERSLPSWTVLRIIVNRWQTEIRVEISVHQMLIGYAMADRGDHGIYLGACDIQIEIGKFWRHECPSMLTIQALMTHAVGLRLQERQEINGLANPDNLSIVVQVLGGVIPQWAIPYNNMDKRFDAEFIIIRGVPSFHSKGGIPLHGLRVFSSKTRVILSATSADAALDGGVVLPWTDLHIRAKDEDLDLVGEALAAVFSGNLLIGVDWADLLLTAGAVRPYGGIGSAVVIQDAPEKDTVSLLHAALARFEENSFKSGLVLIQLVSQPDEAIWNLDGFNALASHVLDLAGNRNTIFTTAMKATRSVFILIAFRLRDNHRFYSGKTVLDDSLGS